MSDTQIAVDGLGEYAKYVLRPDQDRELEAFWRTAQASFWTADEIDLTQDMQDWKDLTEAEQHFIQTILANFVASDGIVTENLVIRFYSLVENPMVRMYYTAQMYMESVHAQVYSLLLDAFAKDEQLKYRLFSSVQHIPSMKAKADWAIRYMSAQSSYAESLIAFAAVEGIYFSGSFCAIFWMRQRGKLPGLGFSNEMISRDEGQHCDFACLMYKRLGRPVPKQKVYEIIREAVTLEADFIAYALPQAMIGMNAMLMTEYIKYVADRLLLSLGYPKIYNSANPFSWMELQSLEGKTNYFERRVGDYKNPKVRMTDAASKHGALAPFDLAIEF